jgi:hypothetical protein
VYVSIAKQRKRKKKMQEEAERRFHRARKRFNTEVPNEEQLDEQKKIDKLRRFHRTRKRNKLDL